MTSTYKRAHLRYAIHHGSNECAPHYVSDLAAVGSALIRHAQVDRSMQSIVTINLALYSRITFMEMA
jgi:hypothetical protein